MLKLNCVIQRKLSLYSTLSENKVFKTADFFKMEPFFKNLYFMNYTISSLKSLHVVTIFYSYLIVDLEVCFYEKDS